MRPFPHKRIPDNNWIQFGLFLQRSWGFCKLSIYIVFSTPQKHRTKTWWESSGPFLRVELCFLYIHIKIWHSSTNSRLSWGCKCFTLNVTLMHGYMRCEETGMNFNAVARIECSHSLRSHSLHIFKSKYAAFWSIYCFENQEWLKAPDKHFC